MRMMSIRVRLVGMRSAQACVGAGVDGAYKNLRAGPPQAKSPRRERCCGPLERGGERRRHARMRSTVLGLECTHRDRVRRNRNQWAGCTRQQAKASGREREQRQGRGTSECVVKGEGSGGLTTANAPCAAPSALGRCSGKPRGQGATRLGG